MKKLFLMMAILAVATCSAVAGTDVSSNIAGSVTWNKADSPYHLKTQIYVLPGATLTIEAGTVVASFVPDQGSLAVCRGAKIYVNGTQCEPVIMTSAEDVANWTGSVVTRTAGDVTAITTMGDPKTGVWREGCNEWGNLTIMGKGLISASHYGGNPVSHQDGYASPVTFNTKCPTGLNKKIMEGLTADAPGDPKVLYGGDDDDDDSGCINYLSIRYGGKVVGLANELNGLSLGAIGRETDIHHIEIMNNVDDGIEIWGGTVNLKYVNIWNIGDDSFDCDEGWRGCAQYGLIVQGYSIDASQGSGVGDNCLEIDGAEDSDAQPVTTARISNFTVVGQPADGDYGTAWRDNARVQYDSCIWMNLGDALIKNDNSDGDGALGYGANGTLTWAQTWTTTYNQWKALNHLPVNTNPPFPSTPVCGAIDYFNIYEKYMCCPLDAPLASITNSVFFSNLKSGAYSESDARGVTVGGDDAPAVGNIVSAGSPIAALSRGAAVPRGGKIMQPVTFIDPISVGDAAGKAGGFLGCNWLICWSAVDAYGMTDGVMSIGSDVNCDGAVDLGDFVEFTNHWLE